MSIYTSLLLPLGKCAVCGTDLCGNYVTMPDGRLLCFPCCSAEMVAQEAADPDPGDVDTKPDVTVEVEQ